MKKWHRDSIWYRIASAISFFYVFYILRTFELRLAIFYIFLWVILVVLVEIKIKTDKKANGE